MNNEKSLKSIIYISKRCPHCRKLLLLLQKKPELKGTIQIVSIDDEPFPKIIKNVPSMVSNGEIWNAEELFAVLEGRKLNPQQSEQVQQSEQTPSKDNSNELLDGYYEDNSSLGFAMLDNSIDNSSYASTNIGNEDITHNENGDGYIKKNNKSKEFDNDYERMLSERGDIDSQIRH